MFRVDVQNNATRSADLAEPVDEFALACFRRAGAAACCGLTTEAARFDPVIWI